MNLIRKISLTLLLLPGCAANLAAQNLPVEIEAVAVPSQLLGHDVNVSVVIPQGADSLRYPVAYMLHGIGGDNSSWLEYGDIARTMQRLVDSGEIAPMVIVMPDGYLSYYSDAADGSLPYESFFTTELMPWVESTLPVIIDKATGHTPAATTSIGGFSMGGFGALTLGLRHPDRFGAIAALSPSIRTDEKFTSEGPQEEFDKQWGRTFGAAGKTGNDRLTPYYLARSPYHILQNLPSTFGQRLLIDIGDRENTLAESNEELHRLLLDRHIPHTYRVRGGGHDFDCWNSALPSALRLFSPDPSSPEAAEACRGAIYRGRVIGGDIPSGSGRDISRPYSSDSIEPQAISASELWLPSANPESRRKYPVLYVGGTIPAPLRRALAENADSLASTGAIAPLAICFLGAEDTPQTIEALRPELRQSQRMRAYLAVDDPISRFNSLHRDANLFTAAILYHPQGNEAQADEAAKIICSHGRYPRLWIVQTPDSPSYPLASRLHILLRQSDRSHKYRILPSSPILDHWEEWLRYLNARIHI